MPRYSTRVTYLDGSSAEYTITDRKSLCAGRVIELTDTDGIVTLVNVAATQSISFERVRHPDAIAGLSKDEIETLLRPND